MNLLKKWYYFHQYLACFVSIWVYSSPFLYISFITTRIYDIIFKIIVFWVINATVFSGTGASMVFCYATYMAIVLVLLK